MALVIRLRQQGRKNRKSYRLVVTDRKEKADGKYVENLGWYDPMLENENALLKQERIAHWISQGAEMTPKAKSLIARCAPESLKKAKA